MTETDIGVYLPVASDALVYIEALMSKSFGLGIDVPSLYLDESEAMIGRPRNLSLGMPAYNEDIAVPRLLASSGSLRCFLLLQCNQLALPFFGSYGDFTESAFFGHVD
jgi:hypothetical protein